MICDDIKFAIEENCSTGCPCSDFECTATTPAPDVTTATVPTTTKPSIANAVLILSTYETTNKPMIVDFEGEKFHFYNLLTIRNSIYFKET